MKPNTTIKTSSDLIALMKSGYTLTFHSWSKWPSYELSVIGDSRKVSKGLFNRMREAGAIIMTKGSLVHQNWVLAQKGSENS
jgi:hypothetical protein